MILIHLTQKKRICIYTYILEEFIYVDILGISKHPQDMENEERSLRGSPEHHLHREIQKEICCVYIFDILVHSQCLFLRNSICKVVRPCLYARFSPGLPFIRV